MHFFPYQLSFLRSWFEQLNTKTPSYNSAVPSINFDLLNHNRLFLNVSNLAYKILLPDTKLSSQGSIVKFWLGPTMCSPWARLFHHFVLHPSPAHFCQLISLVCQGSWSRINWLRSCSQRVRSGFDGYIIALVGFNCLRMPSYEVLYKEDNVYYRLLDLPCILAVANKGFKYLQYGASINGGQSFMSRIM